MTDQVPDGSQGPGEGAVPATPTFSEVPVAATSSEKTFDEDALVEKIVGRLAPEIDKRFQSAKDKRLANLDKLGGVDELLKLKDYIKQQGGDVDKGVREYQIDQLLNQPAQQSSPAPAASRSTVDPASVQKRTAEILNDAGIAYDDPEYVALAGKKNYTSPDDFYHDVARFALRRSKQQTQPGAATLVPEGAGRPADQSKQTKTDKLIARQSELARKPYLSAAERVELSQINIDLRAALGGA